MIDILTVVFRDELPILKVQAQSVDLYCQALNSRNIYVIVNDDDSVADLIDKNWWGSSAAKVTIIPRSIFSIGYLHPVGWHTQQIFKLLGATLSYNPWTLVLDAKTIFVKPLRQEDLIASNTVSRQYQMPIGDNYSWDKCRQFYGSLFDIEITTALSPGGVPFLFNNNIIREMICDVSKRIDRTFTEWFQIHFPSEFMLYNAYLQYKYGIKNVTDGTIQQPYEVYNICHSQFDNYNSIINSAIADSNLLTLSVHRNTWTRLSIDQKEIFINFLVSKNIFSAKELL